MEVFQQLGRAQFIIQWVYDWKVHVDKFRIFRLVLNIGQTLLGETTPWARRPGTSRELEPQVPCDLLPAESGSGGPDHMRPGQRCMFSTWHIPVVRGPVRGEAMIGESFDGQVEAVHEHLEALKQYQEMFEFAPVSYLVTDATGTIQKANRAVASLFLVYQDFLVGKPLADFVAEGDRQAFSTQLAGLQERGERRSAGWETYLQPRGDKPFPATLTVAATRDTEDRLVSLRWLIHDITERVRSKEALRRQAVQLALLNDIGGKIAAVLELESVLGRAACLVQESFGYHHVALFTLDREQDSLVMRARAGSFAHLFPPDHRLKLGLGMVGWAGLHGETLLANDVDAEPHYVNLYADVIPTRSELSVPIQMGEEVVGVLDIQSPQLNAFDENDVIVMETLADQIAVAIENARLYEAIQQELTERQRAEETLRESEERFRSLIKNASDVIVILNADATLRYGSPSLERVLGYKLEEVIGKSIFEFVHPDDLPAAINAVTHGIQDPDPAPFFIEARLRRQDGSWRTLEGTGNNLLGDPAVAGIVLNARDITKRKQHERELEAIASIAAALRAALTLTDMLPVILNQVLALLKADSTALAIRDPASGETAIALAYGAWEDWTGLRWPPGEGVSGQVIATGQPYVTHEAHTDRRITRPDLISDLRTVTCVPLVAEGQAIGALWVGYKNDVTDDDLHLLTPVADIAANAIHRASLHEQIARLCTQLESRERFIICILESIPISLVVIDRTLRIVSVNRNFLEKTRRGVRASVGHKMEVVFPQALVKYTRLKQKVREVFNTGQSVEGGKVAYRAPGLLSRIYYYRLIPLKTGEAVENVLLLMDDITEREQLGEEVRRAERHLASVVECANDLVISMDPQGRIMTWNRAAESTSGLKAEQVKGQSLLSLCPVEQQATMMEMLDGVVHGEKVQNTEVNLLTAYSQEVPIAWSCSPMQDDTGSLVGIVAVGRDLRERHLLEAQLLQSAKMASLGVMAGGIAHELRNPLGIISASVQLMAEHPDDARLRSESTQKIHAATQRASLIIENLLKFARPQSKRMKEIDLNGVLEQTIALLAHQMALQKARLKTDLQPDLCSIYGNPGLLQQVFTNLILNACNAMPGGGSLTITTRPLEAGQVEIRVSDTGHGVAPGHLDKIFDPFFTTMPVGKGTGLGLSICYSIIQQHEGTIEVESQIGQGTTFYIRLPVCSKWQAASAPTVCPLP
jgi:PAS domain S-box-containing protein